jgi:tetratricopeptide (TPR) repeat protein
MEQRGDRSGEVAGLIADHLELAGEQEEALRHLRRAGEAAAGKYANQEAIDYFTRALALVPSEDLETHCELLLAREQVLDLQANRDAQRQDLEALETLAKRIGVPEKQMEVNVRWANYLYKSRDYQAAAAMAERVVVQADAAGNSYFAARGQLSWGRALIWMSQYEIAREHLKLALNGFRATGDLRQEGKTLRSLGMYASSLYDLHAWQEFSQQALSIASQIGDRSAEAEAINHLGVIFNKLGAYPTARKYLSQYLAIAQEIGSKNQERMALLNLGNVATTLKEYSIAQDYHERSLVISQATGNILGEGRAITRLGDALAGQEKWDDSAQVYLQAMELFEQFGAEWGIALSRSGLARVVLAQGDVEEALTFVEAILDYLEEGKGLGELQSPSELHLVCVQVLQAAGDPRAREVLERGFTELQERAEKITDEALRLSFLENVPWNRELVKLWEEQQQN